MTDVRSPDGEGTAIPDDETTRQIVRRLAADGRVSFSELARQVNLSTPALIARVRKLEAAGVIRGYHADVDHGALGLPVAMYALITCTRSGERRLRQDLGRFPEITDCQLILGDVSFVIRASLASVEHAHEFLERLGVYGETRSLTVLDSLPLPDLPARAD